MNKMIVPLLISNPALLNILDTDDKSVPIHLIFDMYITFKDAVRLANLLEKHENTTATFKSELKGTSIIPYLACKHRFIKSTDTIILKSLAYDSEKAKQMLCDFINNIQVLTPLFTADKYENIALTLIETTDRIRLFDNKMFDIIREKTSIPENYYNIAITTGAVISAVESISWGLSTAIIL